MSIHAPALELLILYFVMNLSLFHDQKPRACVSGRRWVSSSTRMCACTSGTQVLVFLCASEPLEKLEFLAWCSQDPMVAGTCFLLSPPCLQCEMDWGECPRGTPCKGASIGLVHQGSLGSTDHPLNSVTFKKSQQGRAHGCDVYDGPLKPVPNHFLFNSLPFSVLLSLSPHPLLSLLKYLDLFCQSTPTQF